MENENPNNSTNKISLSQVKNVNDDVEETQSFHLGHVSSKKSFGKLEKDFKFYFERNNNIWNFGLAPKNDSQIVDYIETIKISGDYSNSLRAISNMEIKLKDGTTTNIWWE